MSKRGQQKVDKKKTKTKFVEFLELDMKAGPSMGEDLEMERRLATRLNLRKGKLDDGGDGFNSLLKGISLFNDSSEDEYNGRIESEPVCLQHIDHKKNKKKGKKKNKSDREVGLHKDGFHDMLTEDSISFDSDEEDEASAQMEMDSETDDSMKQQKCKKRKRKISKPEQDNSSNDGISDMEQANNMSFELGEEAEATTELETDTACANEIQSADKYVARKFEISFCR